MSKLYIIAGCNGAGKTTASYTVLPEILECREFVNADEIAKGLSPFNPSSVAIEAGRLMLKRIGELLSAGVSFSVETTLSTRSYINLIQQAQNQGYSVSLIYFWLNSPELAIERVKQRVANGGHDVPAPIIRRRYRSGLENFFRIYSLAWIIGCLRTIAAHRVLLWRTPSVWEMRSISIIKNFLLKSEVMSTEEEYKELSAKLRYGLELAEQRLIEETARREGTLCYGRPDGKVVRISATELLKLRQSGGNNAASVAVCTCSEMESGWNR